MPGAPIPFLGFEPADDPGRLASDPRLGGAGGVGVGAQLRPIEDVSIAFGQAWNTEPEDIQWHNLRLTGATPIGDP